MKCYIEVYTYVIAPEAALCVCVMVSICVCIYIYICMCMFSDYYTGAHLTLKK